MQWRTREPLVADRPGGDGVQQRLRPGCLDCHRGAGGCAHHSASAAACRPQQGHTDSPGACACTRRPSLLLPAAMFCLLLADWSTPTRSSWSPRAWCSRPSGLTSEVSPVCGCCALPTASAVARCASPPVMWLAGVCLQPGFAAPACAPCGPPATQPLACAVHSAAAAGHGLAPLLTRVLLPVPAPGCSGPAIPRGSEEKEEAIEEMNGS